MKTVGAAVALVLAANDVSPWWVAWMVAGLLLLVAAFALLVREVKRLVRGGAHAAVWVYCVLAGVVVAWLVAGSLPGWVV